MPFASVPVDTSSRARTEKCRAANIGRRTNRASSGTASAWLRTCYSFLASPAARRSALARARSGWPSRREPRSYDPCPALAQQRRRRTAVLARHHLASKKTAYDDRLPFVDWPRTVRCSAGAACSYGCTGTTGDHTQSQLPLPASQIAEMDAEYQGSVSIQRCPDHHRHVVKQVRSATTRSPKQRPTRRGSY
jgi:hypothetical protein